MRRRAFLAGLIASTVLAPMAERLAPPQIMTATSVKDAVEKALPSYALSPPTASGSVEVKTLLSEYGAWVRMSDILSAAEVSPAGRPSMYGPDSYGMFQFNSQPAPESGKIDTNRGVKILGADGKPASELLGQYGFVSWKAAYAAPRSFKAEYESEWTAPESELVIESGRYDTSKLPRLPISFKPPVTWDDAMGDPT